jgi:hypothetical protein
MYRYHTAHNRNNDYFKIKKNRRHVDDDGEDEAGSIASYSTATGMKGCRRWIGLILLIQKLTEHRRVSSQCPGNT